jgi:hypothetical protein
LQCPKTHIQSLACQWTGERHTFTPGALFRGNLAPPKSTLGQVDSRLAAKLMPTNKLWIEHTERAAWESVTALRRELAKTQLRVEQMAPPIEGWQKLFDAIDEAKERHALTGETYADVLRALLARLTAERR